MTRPEVACTLGAVILGTAGAATAMHDMWWEAGLFFFVTAFLLEGADRERRARRTKERHARQQAERAEVLARGDRPSQLPPPCCAFWKSSQGAVHGHDCTRPPAARASLAEAEQRILNRLDNDLRDSA
ncbi:hypothetical protein [Streptomyces sp. NPDC001422]|uniref:hypothetical protein n=1 Tax=Streptomyces sp. NPDC001422 TaxID=3364575 RepID=UPI00368EF6FC